jgi:hypothetical protein
MAILFFSLRGVPEDEADEVRELLFTHQIDFYETSAGNWGISMPALWLRNEAQFAKARQLLDEYQQQRQITQRQLYLQRKQAGQTDSFWRVLKTKPLPIISYLAVMALVIYASIKWLFEFGL